MPMKVMILMKLLMAMNGCDCDPAAYPCTVCGCDCDPAAYPCTVCGCDCDPAAYPCTVCVWHDMILVYDISIRVLVGGGIGSGGIGYREVQEVVLVVVCVTV